jgi:hypothetical protein
VASISAGAAKNKVSGNMEVRVRKASESVASQEYLES